MRIILTNQVDGLGEPGDVVDVKPGFARNYLLPRGFATLWSKGAANQITAIRRARKERAIKSKDHAQEVANWLANNVVTIKTKVGDSGKLFGSVGASDIVEAIAKSGGDKLDKRIVALAHPIKLAGKHRVELKVHPDVKAQVVVEIVSA